MLDILKNTIRGFLDDDAPRLAAALAYYTVFSLPPILILILLLTGVFADPDTIEDRMVEQVEGVLGGDGAQQIQTMIRETADFGGGFLATVLSLLALAFGATGAFHQLQGALNKAWSVAPDPDAGIRTFIVKRLLSFGMVITIAFLLLVSLVLSAFLTRAGADIAEMLPGELTGVMLMLIDAGLSLVISTALFAAMFKVLPDAEIGWGDVAVGAIVTACLFVATKYLFGFFLSLADPGSAFGAAGSLAVILVWCYVAAMVVILGAEFTQAWARHQGARIEPSEGAVKVVTETRPQR